VRIRRVLPIALAGILLVSAVLRLPRTLASFDQPAALNDPAAAWDARMGPVAAALPADVGVVGYLDGADLDPSMSEAEQAEFYLTQYSLAPVVVQTAADQDWIVGNFGSALASSRIRSALDQKLGTYDIQAFGFGIYLIHRPGR
jgi:hypothetical protein